MINKIIKVKRIVLASLLLVAILIAPYSIAGQVIFNVNNESTCIQADLCDGSGNSGVSAAPAPAAPAAPTRPSTLTNAQVATLIKVFISPDSAFNQNGVGYYDEQGRFYSNAGDCTRSSCIYISTALTVNQISAAARCASPTTNSGQWVYDADGGCNDSAVTNLESCQLRAGSVADSCFQMP